MKYLLILLFLVGCQDSNKKERFDEECINRYEKASKETRVDIYENCLDELEEKENK